MEITHGRNLTFASNEFKHRSSGLGFKYLSTGNPSTPENYVLVLAKQRDFYSPIHKHNFDQFRYTVSGSISLTSDLTLEQGQVSYHPEGVPYGPQNDGPEERIVLVLQFGGASGQGFMSLDTLKRANVELSQTGEFKGGKYYPADGGEVVDGYQANWEHVNKRKLVYPEPRYHAPICMEPENFNWKPIKGQGQNSFKKVLGSFSERETRVELLKIEGKGSLTFGGDNAIHLAYVTKGSGIVLLSEAKGEELSQESVVKTPADVSVDITSADTEGIELIHFIMPMMS